MPRLAEKLLVMLWAADGQGALSCPALCRANADVGDDSSCSCRHQNSCELYAQTFSSR